MEAQVQPTIQALLARIEELEARSSRRGLRRLIPKRSVLIVLSALAALSLTGGAFASIPSANGLINACYVPASGMVRVIDASTQRCPTTQRPISWNASGAPISAGTITGVLSISQGGTGSAAKNFVDLSTNQTVSGLKSFTSPIGGSITGNAGTVTNGVYTSGTQTIGGVKTFTNTIQGNVSGNAGSVTNGVYTTGDQSIGGQKSFTGGVSVSGAFQPANGITFADGTVQSTAAKTPHFETIQGTADNLPGNTLDIITLICPNGYVATGGGVYSTNDHTYMVTSAPANTSSDDGWYIEVFNTNDTSSDETPYVNCIRFD